MPTNIVKPGQEADWKRAKKRAAAEGQAGNYAYITSIFTKMTGKKSLEKAFTIPPSFRGGRVPGQVPQRELASMMKLVEMPKQPGMARLLDYTPALTPSSIVTGLGFDIPTQNEWASFLTQTLSSAPNEVVVRKSLYERFIEKRTPPELRRPIFERTLGTYRDLRKGFVEVVTADAVLEKSGARGGSYYRRVKTEKGHRYYYDPDKYHAREDAHVDGASMLQKRVYAKCMAVVQKAGMTGCDMRAFKALSDRHGADKVSAALKQASAANGPVEYKSGYYRMKSHSLEKSERFFITR